MDKNRIGAKVKAFCLSSYDNEKDLNEFLSNVYVVDIFPLDSITNLRGNEIQMVCVLYQDIDVEKENEIAELQKENECVIPTLDQEKFKELYLVELKDGEKNWWLQNGFKASIGNYVVVENDNGLDVGQVIGVGTFHKDVKFYNLPKKTVGVLNEGEE